MHRTTHRLPSGRTARTACAAALAMVLTAGCGIRLTRTEVLQANQVRFQPDQSAAAGPGAAVTDPAAAGASGDGSGVPAAGGSAGAGAAPSGAALSAAPGTGTGTAAGSSATGGAAASTGAKATGGTTPGAAGGKTPGKTPGGGGASGGAGSTPASGPLPAGGSGGETGTIVIGTVGTFSGPAGALDEPHLRAVQMWVSKTNSAGGLAGRKISYVVIDDGGDPARHVAGLRDLAENKKVVSFVGISAPFTAQSGKQYVEQSKVPAIGGSCDTETYEQSNMYFTMCTAFRQLAVNIARAAVQFGQRKKLAIVYCGEAEPCRKGESFLTNGGAKEAGIEIVYRAQTSLVQPDFTAECINAQRAGADAIFPSTGPTATVRLAASCARQGYHPQFIAGPNIDSALRTKPGLDNLLIATSTFPWVGYDTPATQEFAAVYRQYGQGEPTPYSSQGWVTAKMFELAATRAMQTAKSISPKTLIDALYTFNNETLGGLSIPLTFKPGAFTNPSCWWAMQASPESWTTLNGGKLICQ